MSRKPSRRLPIFAAAAAVAVCLAAASSTTAQGPFDAWSGTSSPFKAAEPAREFFVDAELVAPSSAAGTRAVLAVTVTLPPKSYIYSTASGGTLPTRITVTAAEGLEPLAEDFRADRQPKAEFEPALETTIEKFHDTVTWTLPYRLTGSVAGDEVVIRGELTGAYCSTGDRGFCKPIRPPAEFMAKLTIDGNATPVTTVSETVTTPPRTAPDGSVSGVPELPPLNDGSPVEKEAVAESSPADSEFAFDDEFAFDEEFDFGSATDDQIDVLALPGEIADGSLGPDDPFAADREPLVAEAPKDGEGSSGSLAGYLVFAFFGGLILNVMPCVLPVVAIKAMSFVKQAGESRARLLTLNLVYTLGVVAVFLALASLAALPTVMAPVLSALGLSADGIGWGGLFQSLAFNIGMASLVFAMGLSLLGVFEIPVPGMVGSAAGSAQQEGLTGAFLTGVFATLLGTPCSGPLMGPVLGWSVAQPPATTFLVWGVMGLGMASPYLVFGLFPAAVKLLPKPGNWMIAFKQVAGFLLLGTTVFLLRSVEAELLIPVLTALTGLAFGLWIYGQTQGSFEVSKRRLGAAGLAATTLAAGYLGYVQTIESEIEWRSFDGAEVEQLVAEGRTVMVDFTADWCANCKTNEAVAIETDATVTFLGEHDIVAVKADYTRPSEEIEDWLNRYERDAIPLTVIIPAGRFDEPILLDGLFSQATLLDSLEQAVRPVEAVAALPE